MNLVDLFANRWRATIMLLVVIMICGCYAYIKIPKESTPNVNLPIIRVNVRNTGISPQDSELKILKPMETAFRTVPGLKSMSSYAYKGGGEMLLEFASGVNVEDALYQVRAKSQDNEGKLPRKADKPTISSLDYLLHHTISIVISGKVPRGTLHDIATDIKNKITFIRDIGEISLNSDDRIVEVVLNKLQVEKYGISLSEIASKINDSNRMVFTDHIVTSTSSNSIKVPMLIGKVRDFGIIPIKKLGDKVITLSDVAEIRDSFRTPRVLERANGDPAVLIAISKQPGKSISDLVTKVKDVVNKERKNLPGNVNISFMEDESKNIEETVSDLENGVILASILVVVIIMMSIGFKPSILIFMSIPASFLAAVLILYISGITMNIIVLFSLILTVGMVVDDSIVVGEHAKLMMMSGSISPGEAFRASAKRMFLPVLSATSIKIIAFLPLLFWSGIIGQFMGYMPITSLIVLGASLVFAILFQPALGAVLYSVFPDKENEEENKKSVFTFLFKKYENILEKAINKPKRVCLIVLAVLIAICVSFALSGLGSEFFPDIEPERISISIKSDGSFSMEQNERVIKEVEDKIKLLGSEVKIIYSTIRNRKSAIGELKLELIDWKSRRKASEIMKDIKMKLCDIHGIKTQVFAEQGGPKGDLPIVFEVIGKEQKQVDGFADNILKLMEGDEAFINIEDTRPFEGIEWNILIDRKMASYYKVAIGEIVAAIQGVSNGQTASYYHGPDREDEVGVVLRYGDDERSITSLRDTRIASSDGNFIPLHMLAEVTPKRGAGIIKHYDGERAVQIKSGVKEGAVLSEQILKIMRWSKSDDMPQGVSINVKGDIENQKESSSFLLRAFGLAFIIMFGIMLLQFNSFYHAFVIMSAGLISTIGVLLGLLISRQEFCVVMSGIGMIALLGLVLNNNILLVDTYQEIRKKGYSSPEAALYAAKERVRPVILTAITAILGLSPMAARLTINFFDRSITYDAPSSQWWSQLAASISGGLAFATALSLVLTPALLALGGKFDKGLANTANDSKAE